MDGNRAVNGAAVTPEPRGIAIGFRVLAALFVGVGGLLGGGLAPAAHEDEGTQGKGGAAVTTPTPVRVRLGG